MLTVKERHQIERDARSGSIYQYLKDNGYVDETGTRTMSIPEVRKSLADCNDTQMRCVSLRDLYYVFKKYNIKGRKPGRKPMTEIVDEFDIPPKIDPDEENSTEEMPAIIPNKDYKGPEIAGISAKFRHFRENKFDNSFEAYQKGLNVKVASYPVYRQEPKSPQDTKQYQAVSHEPTVTKIAEVQNDLVMAKVGTFHPVEDDQADEDRSSTEAEEVFNQVKPKKIHRVIRQPRSVA